jgi:hypothetical protein
MKATRNPTYTPTCAQPEAKDYTKAMALASPRLTETRRSARPPKYASTALDQLDDVTYAERNRDRRALLPDAPPSASGLPNDPYCLIGNCAM